MSCVESGQSSKGEITIDIDSYKTYKNQGPYKKVSIKYCFIENNMKGDFYFEGTIAENKHDEKAMAFLSDLKRKIEHDTADNQIINAIDEATKFISTMDGRDNNYFFYKFMDSNWQGTGISIMLK